MIDDEPKQRKKIQLGVADAYDRWAPFYDAYDNPMVFMAAEALRASVVPLVAAAPGCTVFEFGCGTGRNLAVLEAAGAKNVAGCDVSEGMLAQARQRLPPPVRVFRHDAASMGPLPFAANGSADIVLFCLTLEHLADLAAPLAEARRIVKPGAGRVAIIEIHPFFSLGGGAAHFEDSGERVEMPVYPHQFADYLNAFARAGLAVTSCREWRPRDVSPNESLPAKVLKRGPDFPLAIEFLLRA